MVTQWYSSYTKGEINTWFFPFIYLVFKNIICFHAILRRWLISVLLNLWTFFLLLFLWTQDLKHIWWVSINCNHLCCSWDGLIFRLVSSPFDLTLVPLKASLLSNRTRYSSLILYISCYWSVIRNFSKRCF